MENTTPNRQAREAALSLLRQASYEPAPSVAFRSQGRLLIVGCGEAVTLAVERLSSQVAGIAVLWTGESALPADPSLASRAHWIQAIPAQVRGYLGAFEVLFDGSAGVFGMESIVPEGEAGIDLVLDLSEQPYIRSESLPPGYFAPGGDAARLEQALSEIPALVGGFEQPQFVSYNPDICAHARSGIEACTRCIDACSAQAIIADGNGIRVNPHLCQGAGGCATACPTGALRYHYPRPGEMLRTIQQVLQRYRDTGGEAPAVLFHDAGIEQERLETLLQALPDSVIPFEVEEVASLGLDIWLTTLAFGAVHVAILRSARIAPSSAQEIDRQISYAAALLEAMGYPGGAVQWLTTPGNESSEEAGLGEHLNPPLTPAAFAVFDDKRTMIHLALGHLHAQAPARRPLASLPTGAPFGEVWLNEGQCTLCMACVAQCPGRALQSGSDLPQLKFVEDNCVQCGLCARSCPEDAIGPSPRYLFDDVQRRRVRVLKEDEPFCCISCGKPFATRGAIYAVLGKLQGHPMFGPTEMERLKMCEDCRVRALYDKEQQALAPAGEETT